MFIVVLAVHKATIDYPKAHNAATEVLIEILNIADHVYLKGSSAYDT